MDPTWDADATPQKVSAQLHVKVPHGAGDLRAARHEGFQDDGLLLAFTLPNSKVDEFLDQLAPDAPLRQRDEPRTHQTSPLAPFSHLGLKEPESLAEVREGQVCAPCGGELDSLRVAVHRLDATSSRIYLRGVD
ncbi:hypothetical protein ACFQ61_02585 [Streptomyces sp. NPDC056500]|uniref:hypothetical protein n=1 Tax=Streptomyces sp. NPDC056500 TaxID=3345840 RepID=UPI003686FFBD